MCKSSHWWQLYQNLWSLLSIQPVLQNAGGGEGVYAGTLLIAGEVAGKLAFGVVGGEILAGAVQRDLGAEDLAQGEDEALGEFGLVGDAAVGVEGEADDDGVDGFLANELADGLGKLGIWEAFKDFEGEGEARLGIAEGDAGAFEAVVDGNESHAGSIAAGHAR